MLWPVLCIGAIVMSSISVVSAPGNPSFAEDSAPVKSVDVTPTLVVSPDSPVLDVVADSYRFTVLLQPAGDTELSAGEVVLSIDSMPVHEPAGLSVDAEAGQPLELARLLTPQIEAGATEELSFEVPRADFPLLLTRAAGVYMLRAELFLSDPATTGSDAVAAETGEEPEAAETAVTAATPVVWGKIQAEPISLTLVVPLLLPDSVSGVPDADALTAAAPSLLRLLTAAEHSSATLALDPRILVGVRALGPAAPAPARELLERIEQTLAPIFLLQFADADPAVQAALGFDELLQPTGFDYVIDEANFQDSTAGAPSLDDLLDLPNARSGAWPASAAVDQHTLTLLAHDELTSVVLDSGNVNSPSSARVALGEFEALVADHDTNEAARLSLAAATATEQGAGQASLVARLALAAEQQQSGMVLALDRAALTEPERALSLLDLLDSLSWVQTVTEFMQPLGAATLRPGTSDEVRVEHLKTLLQRSDEIDELAPLLVHHEYLTQFQRVRTLESLSAKFAGDKTDFNEVAENILKQDEQLLRGVRPVISESAQLVSTSSQLPITLHNSLPFDAVVRLRAAPTSAVISISDPVSEAEVPASGNATVLLPVHSRVSSGETGVALKVRALTDDKVFASAVQHLTLRTRVETMLLTVLGGAAALLFGFGIWRSIRRKRLGLNTGAIPVITVDEAEEAAVTGNTSRLN